MVQTSVYICNNVNLGPERCLRCLVVDQGGSDKVAQFKIEGRGSGPAIPPIESSHVIVHRAFRKKMGFQVLLIFILQFKNIISYKQCIEHNNKIYD